jgi:hypothetical protein
VVYVPSEEAHGHPTDEFQFIFGYDTGQISGFLEMPDFLNRFADQTDPETGRRAFSNWKSGLIVALVSHSTSERAVDGN